MKTNFQLYLLSSSREPIGTAFRTINQATHTVTMAQLEECETMLQKALSNVSALRGAMRQQETMSFFDLKG